MVQEAHGAISPKAAAEGCDEEQSALRYAAIATLRPTFVDAIGYKGDDIRKEQIYAEEAK